MRHQPLAIYRVTRETAAELIMDASRRHALACVQHHPHGIVIMEPFGVAQ